MRKFRIAAGGLAAALLISLLPAAALGAADSLSVTGPNNVTAGSSPKFVVKGNASKMRGLAVYVDSRPCAKGVVKEQKRASSSNPRVSTVNGNFRNTVTVPGSHVGSHYICAYLYHKSGATFVTDRKASHHYVTH